MQSAALDAAGAAAERRGEDHEEHEEEQQVSGHGEKRDEGGQGEEEGARQERVSSTVPPVHSAASQHVPSRSEEPRGAALRRSSSEETRRTSSEGALRAKGQEMEHPLRREVELGLWEQQLAAALLAQPRAPRVSSLDQLYAQVSLSFSCFLLSLPLSVFSLSPALSQLWVLLCCCFLLFFIVFFFIPRPFCFGAAFAVDVVLFVGLVCGALALSVSPSSFLSPTSRTFQCPPPSHSTPFLPSSLPPFRPSSLPPFLPSSLPLFLPASPPPGPRRRRQGCGWCCKRR
eukprot:1693361-Rhodomonas_salina.3